MDIRQRGSSDALPTIPAEVADRLLESAGRMRDELRRLAYSVGNVNLFVLAANEMHTGDVWLPFATAPLRDALSAANWIQGATTTLAERATRTMRNQRVYLGMAAFFTGAERFESSLPPGAELAILSGMGLPPSPLAFHEDHSGVENMRFHGIGGLLSAVSELDHQIVHALPDGMAYTRLVPPL